MMGVMPSEAIKSRLEAESDVTDLVTILDKWPAEPRYTGDPNGTPEAFDHGFMIPCLYVAPGQLNEHPTEGWQGVLDSFIPVYFFSPTTPSSLDATRSAIFQALHRKKLAGVLSGYGWTTWAGDGVVRVDDPFPDTETDYSRFRVTVRRDTESPEF